jgi:hypothetical protein
MVEEKLKLKGLSRKEKYEKLKQINFESEELRLKEEITIKAIEKYSPKNKILIILQHGLVEEVKGFREWEKLGLKPIPNSGIFIYAPNLYRNNDTEETELKGFRLIPIFDKNDLRPMTTTEKEKSKFFKGE